MACEGSAYGVHKWDNIGECYMCGVSRVTGRPPLHRRELIPPVRLPAGTCEEVHEQSDDKADFRLQAKNIFLTYAQCNKSVEDIVNVLREKFEFDKYTGVVEKHKDGNPHVHLLIKLTEKPDIRDCRSFDVEKFHPNIQVNRKTDDSKKKGTSWKAKKIHYIHKTGRNVVSENFDPLDTGTSIGYKRRKADWDEWKKDKKPVDNPFPFMIDWIGQEIKETTEKKRHWAIWGPPNCGKSEWRKKIFNEFNCFIAGGHPDYPWEGYRNQTVMLWDDVFPRATEVLQMCELENSERACAGKHRYQTPTLKPGIARVFIFIGNEKEQEGQEMPCRPDYMDTEPIRTRFTEIFLDRSLEDPTGNGRRIIRGRIGRNAPLLGEEVNFEKMEFVG